MDFLSNHIESLIFCSTEAIKESEIKSCLDEMFESNILLEDIQKSLEELTNKYKADIYPFRIEHSGGGFQFFTKPEYQASIGILLKQKSPQ